MTRMQNCDVVMKGGITSGIVYPGAVTELAKEYRFVNIGGTSAGAIAAALTAAAEYRRQNGSSAGFDELSRLPAWLAATDGDRSRLLQLFEPNDETRPLFDVAIALLSKNAQNIVRALVRNFTRFGGVVLAAAAIVAMLLIFFASGIGATLVVLLTFIVAAIGFVVAAMLEAIVMAWRILPRHGFALSSGDALAQWLASKIDEVAASDHPLTFGDLASRGINLEMMTTNLTHGRPYRLPLRTKQFFFRNDEMSKLFPPNVVAWMQKHARPTRTSGLFSLPDAHDLPVVVATRMSLSFPLLLSAVPLWSIDFGRRDAARVPERCWFSDGGITSNFPVHFFDAPLPRWPTFAFNLAARTPRYHDDAQEVYVPTSNRGGVLEWWTPIATVGDFLKAIVMTMQNWRDNMLLHLPGQRDRIAHVLLDDHEGGLHLTMDPETITRVAAKGAKAGRIMRERFGGAAWTNHRWVRFLAFTPALEETLERWSEALPLYDDLLSGDAPLPSYKVSAQQRAAMRTAAFAFLRHLQEDLRSKPFRSVTKRPRPEPVLRAVARE